MLRRLLTTCVGLSVAFTPLMAVAQGVDEDTDVPLRAPNGASFDPDKATDPLRLVEGPGLKVNEDTTFHPVFGLETGAISNVFYTNNSNCPATGQCVHAAGFLRALIQVGIGSLTAMRLTPSDQAPVDPFAIEPMVVVPNPGAFQWRADVRAAYDQMLSPDGTVSDSGGLSLGTTLRGTVHPYGPVSLIGIDDFERLIRAANFETSVDTNRDINNLWLRVPYHPHDHTYGGFAYYSNTIDVFERQSQQFSDRMLNEVGLHPTYALLPLTHLYADISQGFDGGLGSSSTKVSSYPTTLTAGIATLLTPLITLNASAGYTWLNYASGANASGIQGGLAVGYRYSELGRLVFQYVRQYEDSINANFYDEHLLRAWAYQRVGRLVFSVQPELHFRTYHGTVVTSTMGTTDRADDIFSIVAGVSYNLKDQLQLALDYRFTDLSTDFRYMTDWITIDPSYARHAVLLGIRVAL